MACSDRGRRAVAIRSSAASAQKAIWFRLSGGVLDRCGYFDGGAPRRDGHRPDAFGRASIGGICDTTRILRFDCASQADAHLEPKHHVRYLMILSGDRDSEVQHLADIVGISDVRSSLAPEEKLRLYAPRLRKPRLSFWEMASMMRRR